MEAPDPFQPMVVYNVFMICGHKAGEVVPQVIYSYIILCHFINDLLRLPWWSGLLGHPHVVLA